MTRREKISLEDGKHFLFEEDVAARCPCGKFVRFGKAVNAPGVHSNPETLPVALHATPHCAMFQELDLLAYTSHVRQNLEAVIATGSLRGAGR